MWIIYSFLTALCETGKDVVGKNVAKNVNEYVMSFSLQLFAFLVLLPIVVIQGIPELKPAFWITFFYGALFSLPAWSILYMKGLKLSPLSVSIPMLSFNPIITAGLAIFFEKRFPNAFGWLGIICITAGLYLSRLNRDVLKKNILLPLLTLKDEPGSLCMLGVAFIWGIGGFVAKISSNASSPLFSSFSSCLGSTFVILTIAKWRKSEINFRIVKENFPSLFSLGALNGFSELFFKTGTVLGYVPFVASLKRTNMIFSSFLGKVFFDERLGRAKIAGILLMFIGVLLLVVFK